uniref:NADH:flavin oxidoreductase/NADH oxidase N-terminal domain-containing protein n=1 Tax=Phytophthora ramorum TaxID=164328 RepID=H3G9B6_PHYRM
MVSAIVPKLFTPLKLGGKKNPIELAHRITMAPLTRLRTGESGVPTALVAEYYAQRATDGGLLIAEATNISATARGYFGAPGVFTQEQVDGWKLATSAVHAKGGKFVLQLWHTGRVGHPLNQPNGELPVSSSATSVDGIRSHAVTREGRRDHVTPRAVDIEEIPSIVADYKRAAENAIAAGFDGVEIHAANGYFLEQFLCDGVNKRTDKYGGSIENRARLIFEVVEAVLSSLPSSQVGIRLSPFGDTFDCKDSTPRETYGYVVDKLNDYDLAYVHVIERRGMHAANVQVPEVGVARHFRDAYKGVLISAAGYDREDAVKTVEEGAADLIAFGGDFIATPDLVERLRIGAELNTPNMKTFYPQPDVPLEAGYTDYPFLAQKE